MKKIFTTLFASCLLAVFYFSTVSYSGGAHGYAASGCSCHGNLSIATSVMLSGFPASGYVLGNTYTLVATVSNATKPYAGFDLSVSSGILTAGVGSTVSGSNISHNAAKAMASGATSWTFTYTAPSSGGAITFNLAGNAVDNTGGTSGDQWTKLPFTIQPNGNAPAISNVAASNLLFSSATVSADVNANNAATTASIEYGTTTSYGSTASPVPSTVSGTGNTNTIATLSGLSPNTLYHCRVAATNANGTTYSNDFTFKTTMPTSVQDLLDNGFTIAPQPVGNGFELSVQEKIIDKIALINMKGQVVKSMDSIASQRVFVNTESLRSGNYILKVVASNKMYWGKIAK